MGEAEGELSSVTVGAPAASADSAAASTDGTTASAPNDGTEGATSAGSPAGQPSSDRPDADAPAPNAPQKPLEERKPLISDELGARVNSWKPPKLPDGKLTLTPLGGKDTALNSFKLRETRTVRNPDGTFANFPVGSLARVDLSSLSVEERNALGVHPGDTYVEFGGSNIWEELVDWGANQKPPLFVSTGETGGHVPAEGVDLSAKFTEFLGTEHGKRAVAEKLLKDDADRLAEAVERAEEEGNVGLADNLRRQLATKTSELTEFQQRRLKAEGKDPLQEHLGHPELQAKIQEAADHKNPEEAVAAGLEHFRQLLKASGLSDEEVDVIMKSTVPIVPALGDAAAANAGDEIRKDLPKDESQKPPNANELPAETKDGEDKKDKTLFGVLKDHLKKLKSKTDDIEKKLNNLHLSTAAKWGDAAANWVKNNADFGALIAYMCTGECYGKIAEGLGYKSADELEKQGFVPIGPLHIEAYTHADPKAELTLLCEGLVEGQVISSQKAGEFLTNNPVAVLTGTEFKSYLQVLLVEPEKRAKFDEKVAFIVSKNDTRAKLSNEGFAYIMMIPEKAKNQRGGGGATTGNADTGSTASKNAAKTPENQTLPPEAPKTQKS